MTKEEALKLALEALEELNNTNSHWWQEVDRATIDKIDPAIIAIKEALAQPVQEPVIKQGWDVDTLLDKPAQEPVAWEQFYPDIGKPQIAFNAEVVGYVAPQREWVGLTSEETSGFTSHEMTVVKYVSKVLQEKNHG